MALSEVHPLTHPSNAAALEQLEGWLKMAPDNMAIYDYNMKYCPSWDAMAEKIRWYSQKGIRGLWFCGSPSNFRDLFTHMVRGEMMRDPNQDPEKIKAAYVRKAYGPAADAVMEYLTLHKKRLEKGYPRGIHNHSMPAAYYTDDGFGDRCLKLFDKMIEAVKGARLEAKFESEKKMFASDMKRAIKIRDSRGQYDPTAPEKLDNGVRMIGSCFVGGRGPMDYGWMCRSSRMSMFVYPAKGPFPTSMKADFELARAPDKAATLKIEGMSSDKFHPPSAPIRITINGKKVFEGPCELPPLEWEWRTFEVDEGVLRKGKNTIKIENLTDSARLDHWWVAIAEARVLY